jgi:RNA polymerase sigma-70 factor (sigma-E family)
VERTTGPLGTERTVGRRDRSGFAEFAQARAGALHRAAYLMVGDSQLAQDLVQEALTKTYVAWPRLRDPRNAEAYCRKAITTTAISWFRRKSWDNERPTEYLPEHPVAGTTQEQSVADRDAVWRALRQLPPRQRAALVLRFYEDLTEAQTAAAMGCAVGTVKSQVSAGLKKLRERLGHDVELLSPDESASEEAMTR